MDKEKSIGINREGAIKQLKDLIVDRKTFCVGDYDPIFDKDIQALEYAVNELEKVTLQMPFKEEKDKEMQKYLIKFQKNVYSKVEKEFLEEEVIEIGNIIIKMLKEKELTYVDAYATLEYVYRSLKVMSEYTHL